MKTNDHTRIFLNLAFFLLTGISFSFSETVKKSEDDLTNFISSSKCEKMALDNHSSVRLAKEEMEVADLKEKEALRAIFPALSIKGEQTTGVADQLSTPNFTQKNYGVQISQALFQGGKLHNTYQQAHENRLSAITKLTKAEQEVIFHVRETYWNMVKARRALNIHLRALTELKKEKEMADKLLHPNERVESHNLL